MERFYCLKIETAKICPYNVDTGILLAEYCDRCNYPDIYKGIRPKVPDSHCEAGDGNHMPYDMELKPMHPEVMQHIEKMKVCNTKGEERKMRKLYEYMMKHSKVFKNLGMDQQGELIIKMKESLDKADKFK